MTLQLTAERKSLRKELGRRRVFLFFLVLGVVALANTITEEADMPQHVLDDYIVTIAFAIGLIFILASWKKQSITQIRMQHNVILVLLVIALIAKLYAISVEAGDAQDIADDIPSIFVIVFMLANKFV